MTVHVIYGTDGGVTRSAARRIAKKIDAKKISARVIDVKVATIGDFEACDLLILGIPTYGEGDLQSDWEENLGTLRASNISGKPVALFGTGDQANYPDTFVDAMGTLYDIVVEQGAMVTGATETAGYTHRSSAAARGGRFVGLALDEDGQSSLTEKRITSWISQLA